MRIGKKKEDMSLMERLIVRMNTQREVLEFIYELNGGKIDGYILEVGLGSGRAYDHLRHQYPKNRIFAFDYKVDTRPEVAPKPEDTILGEVRETLPKFSQENPEAVGMIHLDIGDHDLKVATIFYNSLAPIINHMTKPGAWILADRFLELPGWKAVDINHIIAEWPYFVIRKE